MLMYGGCTPWQLAGAALAITTHQPGLLKRPDFVRGLFAQSFAQTSSIDIAKVFQYVADLLWIIKTIHGADGYV